MQTALLKSVWMSLANLIFSAFFLAFAIAAPDKKVSINFPVDNATKWSVAGKLKMSSPKAFNDYLALTTLRQHPNDPEVRAFVRDFIGQKGIFGPNMDGMQKLTWETWEAIPGVDKYTKGAKLFVETYQIVRNYLPEMFAGPEARTDVFISSEDLRFMPAQLHEVYQAMANSPDGLQFLDETVGQKYLFFSDGYMDEATAKLAQGILGSDSQNLANQFSEKMEAFQKQSGANQPSSGNGGQWAAKDLPSVVDLPPTTGSRTSSPTEAWLRDRQDFLVAGEVLSFVAARTGNAKFGRQVSALTTAIVRFGDLKNMSSQMSSFAMFGGYGLAIGALFSALSETDSSGAQLQVALETILQELADIKVMLGRMDKKLDVLVDKIQQLEHTLKDEMRRTNNILALIDRQIQDLKVRVDETKLLQQLIAQDEINNNAIETLKACRLYKSSEILDTKTFIDCTTFMWTMAHSVSRSNAFSMSTKVDSSLDRLDDYNQFYNQSNRDVVFSLTYLVSAADQLGFWPGAVNSYPFFPFWIQYANEYSDFLLAGLQARRPDEPLSNTLKQNFVNDVSQVRQDVTKLKEFYLTTAGNPEFHQKVRDEVASRIATVNGISRESIVRIQNEGKTEIENRDDIRVIPACDPKANNPYFIANKPILLKNLQNYRLEDIGDSGWAKIADRLGLGKVTVCYNLWVEILGTTTRPGDIWHYRALVNFELNTYFTDSEGRQIVLRRDGSKTKDPQRRFAHEDGKSASEIPAQLEKFLLNPNPDPNEEKYVEPSFFHTDKEFPGMHEPSKDPSLLIVSSKALTPDEVDMKNRTLNLVFNRVKADLLNLSQKMLSNESIDPENLILKVIRKNEIDQFAEALRGLNNILRFYRAVMFANSAFSFPAKKACAKSLQDMTMQNLFANYSDTLYFDGEPSFFTQALFAGEVRSEVYNKQPKVAVEFPCATSEFDFSGFDVVTKKLDLIEQTLSH